MALFDRAIFDAAIFDVGDRVATAPSPIRLAYGALDGRVVAGAASERLSAGITASRAATPNLQPPRVAS